jgi:multidrug efflux pump subunit AcrA (membrane-fusion protein)
MGVNTSNVVTFEVRIEITSENKSLLKPEMTANVEIVIAEKDNALTVPVGAVSRIRGVYSVSVLSTDGSAEVREVEVGINNGERMEIISGLDENDTIIIREGEAFSQWSREGGPPPGNPMRFMGGRRPGR